MKWFKMFRGLIFGIALIVVPFTTGDPFDSTRSILVSVGFMLLGTALCALVVWAAIRQYRQYQLEQAPIVGPRNKRKHWSELP